MTNHYWKPEFSCQWKTDTEIAETDRKIRKSIFLSVDRQKTPTEIKRQRNKISVGVNISLSVHQFFCRCGVHRIIIGRRQENFGPPGLEFYPCRNSPTGKLVPTVRKITLLLLVHIPSKYGSFIYLENSTNYITQGTNV
jgi:hypothetical protein